MMPPVIELIRCRKAGRPAADDSNSLAASVQRDSRRHPSVPECRLNDIEFVVVDRDRLAVHPADTGLFAECRANPPGELREVAGLKKSGQRVPGVVQIYLVVPLRDHIVKGTPRDHPGELHRTLAHGNAAVHAARPLLPSLLIAKRQVKLQIVRQSLQRLPVNIIYSLIFQKSCRFSHNTPLTFPETPPEPPCRAGFPAPHTCRLP